MEPHRERHKLLELGFAARSVCKLGDACIVTFAIAVICVTAGNLSAIGLAFVIQICLPLGPTDLCKVCYQNKNAQTRLVLIRSQK